MLCSTWQGASYGAITASHGSHATHGRRKLHARLRSSLQESGAALDVESKQLAAWSIWAVSRSVD
jgi:hypothetical protein